MSYLYDVRLKGNYKKTIVRSKQKVPNNTEAIVIDVPKSFQNQITNYVTIISKPYLDNVPEVNIRRLDEEF